MPSGKCHFCGTAVDLEVPVGNRDYCEECKRDLHCCKNCKFYAPGYPNDCMETFSPFIRDREAYNFCHYFVFRISMEATEAEQSRVKDELERVFGPTKAPPVKPDFVNPIEELKSLPVTKKIEKSKTHLGAIFEENAKGPPPKTFSEGIEFARKRQEEREKAPEKAKQDLEKLFEQKPEK